MTTDPEDIDGTLAAEGSLPRTADGGAERGTVVGRYVVLDRIGAGGMGVVYAAYDPELDRKVAVKLLRGPSPAGTAGGDERTRLHREAQALAKLAHPNVVAVFDVGTRGDRIWLAMEFVEGRTLGAWLRERPRTWRQIVDVVSRAGRGLAAAHAAGLLHRDFKPDNVMVSDDGRARVMDFGLARTGRATGDPSDGAPLEPAALSQSALSAEMTRTGAMMGTPAYMAPEQIRGRADERSDQFAFCITLWEALYGERPFVADTLGGLVSAILDGQVRAPPRGRRVPRWLRRICLRGLSSEPSDRFASLDALLAVIERGRSRRRTVSLLGAGAAIVAIAGGVQGVRGWEEARRRARCDAAGAAMDALWDDTARRRVREGLLATDAANASTTADKVTTWLDAHAEALREHRVDACLRTEVARTWDASMRERADFCLDEREIALRSLVAELEDADAELLQSAVIAASSLTEASPCLDSAVLEHFPTPPSGGDRELFTEVRAEAARIEAGSFAGKSREALERLDAVKERAAAIDWPPLQARLRLQEAVILLNAGEHAEAEAAATDAYLAATKAGAWDLAASAAARLVMIVGYGRSRYDEGRLWSRLGEAAESLAGDPLGAREAMRLGNLASVEYAAGDYDEAIRVAERALELRTAAHGEDHPDIATTLANLAIAYWAKGRYQDGLRVAKRALEIMQAGLGEDHPEVARSLNNLGLMLRQSGSLEEAREMLERSVEIRERVLGPSHPDLAAGLDSLANTLGALGEHERARDLFDRALKMRESILGPDHSDVIATLNNLANLYQQMDEPALAQPLFRRALDTLERTASTDHRLIGIVAVNLGSTYLTTGDPASAIPLYESAIEHLEKSVGPGHDMVALVASKLGRAHEDLGHHEAAIEALERALAIFQAVPDGPREDPGTHIVLAEAMLAAGRDRALALRHAHEARDALDDGADASPQLREEIDAFLAEQDEAR